MVTAGSVPLFSPDMILHDRLMVKPETFRTADLDHRQIAAGGEGFLKRSLPGAVVYLGHGPARGSGASSDRLRRFLKISDLPFSEIHWGTQVHGTTCRWVQTFAGGRAIQHAATDALASNLPGLALAVWTADCVPVLLSDGRSIAAAHCGWRGLAAGILPQTLAGLERRFGCSPADLRALIGPAIGSCHYEVGDNVVSGLSSQNIAPEHWLDGRHADLRAFARSQLMTLGLQEQDIELVGRCTYCDTELASYRRDGLQAGRQFSLICLTPGDGDGDL